LSHRFHKEFGCPMILRWSVVLLHCEETMLQESVSRLPQLMTDLSDAKAQKKLYSKPKCRGLEEIAASADSEALKSKSTPAFWTTPTHGGAATKCGACAAKPAADFLIEGRRMQSAPMEPRDFSYDDPRRRTSEKLRIGLYAKIKRAEGDRVVPTLNCQSRAATLRLIRRHQHQFRTSYSLFTIPLG
jgi:hypothetical protein